MRVFSTLLFSMLLAAGAAAQAGKMKQAQQRMDNLDYVGAIETYNEILESHDEAKAKINLAEAYRKINDTQNAEFWYGQVVRLPEAEPVHKLYYGMMLQRNGKCDVAKDWYQQYVDLVPTDQRGQFLLRACDYDEELMARGQGIFEVSKCDFNSHSDDFSPQFYKNGLVFSSERDTNPIVRRTHTWTGNPFLELYYVDVREKGERTARNEKAEKGEKAEKTEKTDTGEAQAQPQGAACGKYAYGRPEKFSNEINSKYHDASVAFSRNGEEVFFTRNSFLDGKKELDDAGIMRLKIFYARSAGEGKWGDLQSLPFNSNEYSVAHPALAPDGNRLFFASDMPGGFGGMDLYYSDKESGRWGPPNNLGPEINTEGHEIFPHVSPDGKVYFASDGHVGLGGLDVFYIVKKEGSWSSPENVGFPVNTISDDFGIVFNQEGTCGFFSSDREGGVGGDDVYSFRKTAVSVEVLVYDERNELPLPGATVVVACKQDTMTTDAEGKIRFDMKLNACCDLSASFEDYQPNKVEGCTKNLTLSDKLTVKIPLRMAAEFSVYGVVFDALTGLAMEGATVTLENDCGKTAAEPFTTSVNGSYNFKLDKDCCYKIKAEMDGYFAAIENACTKGLDTTTNFQYNLFLKPTSIASIPEVPGKTTEQIIAEGLENQTKETPYTYFDKELGLWMDKDTRQPATGKYDDGNLYEKGVLQKGELSTVGPTPVTQTTPEIPYLLHIYYDYDQAYIRDEAIPELEKLYTVLVENAKFIIEIGSHTDSRASDHYNQRLSQRRAESVVRWLTDKGIDRSRLVAKGYGETVNVNDCKDNIPCSPQQHQMNRRTEFKVIGCRNCKNKKVYGESNANENAKVVDCTTCPF